MSKAPERVRTIGPILRRAGPVGGAPQRPGVAVSVTLPGSVANPWMVSGPPEKSQGLGTIGITSWMVSPGPPEGTT
jgi:hypothetical protein